jgi:Domain of unknown function (DUF4352)
MIKYLKPINQRSFIMQPMPQQPFDQQPPMPMTGSNPIAAFLTRRVAVPMFALILVGLCMCSLLLVAVARNGNTTSATANTGSVTQTATPGKTSTKTTQHFKVGDAVSIGTTFTITINSFGAVTSSNSFEQPASGNVYVLVDMSIKNISTKEQDVSSILSMTFRDATGQKYTEKFLSDYSSTPDGKVEPGDQIRGQLVYEVPRTQHNFTFAFEPDFLSTGQTIWDLTD